MGIQINGNTNNINAGIGSLSIEDIHELDLTGIATASNFKTGVSNLHNVGLTLSGGQIDVGSNIKIGTAGVITATSFVGSGANLTSLPAQATISNNADDRVITGGSGVNLNGEQRLTFNSSNILTATETGTGNGMGGIRAATANAGGNAGYGFMTNSANRFAVTTIGSEGSESLRIYDDNNNAERLRILGTGPHLLLGGTSSVNEITETSSSSGLVIGNTSMGNGGLAIINSTTGTGRIYFGDSVGGNAARNRGQINYYHNGDYMLFAVAGSERLRIASNGKIYVKGNGGDVSTDFSDAGTFFNLKHDTYGGRIGFGNGTASAGVTLMEQLGYWGSNKVAGWVMTAGGDATNKDDGEMSFYTRESGQAIMERLHIGSEGEVVAGYRVGTSSVRSNQPVAFHSTNITPHGNARRVSTGQRCNLFVGSNSGWSSGDGGVIAMGGSETGGAGVEATWAYVAGKRQSGNGWEYGGYFEVGTSPYSGTVMAKRMRLWANGQMEVYPNDDTFYSTSIGGAQRMVFKHNGGGAIEIKNNNGNMTFTSSSDYRLKKDEVAISNALSTVKALKPYQFTWKTDGKLGQGFFAHEAQAVLPDIGVVSGTKDEVHTNDETENGGQYKKDDPIYQGIDYSKLVPLLTAALQEETAKREALEARVAALEGS